MSRAPLVIGWKEYVAFPDWGLMRVKVKIDTGARTAALDAFGYEIIPGAQGGSDILLRLSLDRRRPSEVMAVRVPLLGEVRVRNTSGRAQTRPLIETTFCLGGIARRIRLTVCNRSRMLFPVILGRTSLAGDFLVDVSQKYLQGRPRRREDGPCES